MEGKAEFESIFILRTIAAAMPSCTGGCCGTSGSAAALGRCAYESSKRRFLLCPTSLTFCPKYDLQIASATEGSIGFETDMRDRLENAPIVPETSV